MPQDGVDWEIDQWWSWRPAQLEHMRSFQEFVCRLYSPVAPVPPPVPEPEAESDRSSGSDGVLPVWMYPEGPVYPPPVRAPALRTESPVAVEVEQPRAAVELAESDEAVMELVREGHNKGSSRCTLCNKHFWGESEIGAHLITTKHVKNVEHDAACRQFSTDPASVVGAAEVKYWTEVKRGVVRCERCQQNLWVQQISEHMQSNKHKKKVECE